MNSKGVSTVIATVLLVLITVAAAAILMQFVVPFVQSNLQKSTECVKLQEYFTFEDMQQYNCISQSENKAKVSIRAQNDENLQNLIGGFELSFNGEGSKRISSKDGQDIEMLSENKEFKLPLRGEVRTYSISLEEDYYDVEIYPVLISGRICPASDKIELRDCT